MGKILQSSNTYWEVLRVEVLNKEEYLFIIF